VALVNSTIDTLRKITRLRDRTDRAWFSRLLRHPAKKRSESIHTTSDPTRGPRELRALSWSRTQIALQSNRIAVASQL